MADKETVGAGVLRHRFAFDERVEVDDGAGNTVGEWQEGLRCRVRREALKGGEAVMASRLERKQPYIMTLRAFAASRRITTDWRARDVRSGATYAITSVVERPQRNCIDIMVVEGAADG